MSVKQRVQELNTRLAEKLTNKGVHADGTETTTALINKVDDIVNKIPDGYIKPEGTLDIKENGTFDVREKAEVNVQVVAKPAKPYIDSSKLKYGAYMFANKDGSGNTLNTDLSLMKNTDTSEMVDVSYMLRGRNDLTSADIETINNMQFGKVVNAEYFVDSIEIHDNLIIDMPSVKSLRYALSNIKVCEGSVTLRNTSKCENFSIMTFASNIRVIKELDTSSGKNFQQVFYSSEVETIDSELDFSNATNVNYAFSSQTLVNVRFKAIRVFDNNLSFAACPKLSVDSLLSIINALSDNTGLDTTYKVTLGSGNLAKLTQEQKEIAYNKNITLA